jgi:hypothetical protein
LSLSRDSSVTSVQFLRTIKTIFWLGWCPDFSVISLQKKTKVQVVKRLQRIESQRLAGAVCAGAQDAATY